MEADYTEYRKRGGTQRAIADAWKKTPGAVQRVVRDHPDRLVIEFSAEDPNTVQHAFLKRSTKVLKKKILF